MIPGSGRSPAEGIVYPLQYSWSSLVAQMGKNPPAMKETWVQSLGWEDPLEQGITTHQYSGLEKPWTMTEPDILECEVKWALGSITMNKASGGDGISDPKR